MLGAGGAGVPPLLAASGVASARSGDYIQLASEGAEGRRSPPPPSGSGRWLQAGGYWLAFVPDPDAGAGERTRFGLYQAVTHAAKLMPLRTRMQALQEVTSRLQPPA